MSSVYQILKDYWGYDDFRPMQEDIIQSSLDGNDTVVLLPTGGGKSICYQLPPLVSGGICIVVSPLVALMNDQVNNLRERGIKALHLSGGLKQDEVVTLLDNARFGGYSFLYLSPERLQNELVQNAIRKMDVSLIAIDEAHCISQWGNDFRPAYLEITILRELHPLVPIMALTATATPKVLQDTIAQLNLEAPKVFQSSFRRENISYQVKKSEDKAGTLKSMLLNSNDSSIVYVRSRKLTVETSEQLNHMGISATFYHGGLTPDEKTERLKQWKLGNIHVMVATNAFGMGIDKADVRNVIHIQLPESIESYYQEAGRAGRDGNESVALVVYSDHDIALAKKQFIESLPGKKDLKKLYKLLSNYFQISYGEGAFTDHPFNFGDFCHTYGLLSSKTYNGLNMLDRLGLIRLSKQFGRRSTMRFLGTTDQLLEYFRGKQKESLIGKSILRVYGGIFELMTPINLQLISNKTGRSVDEITEVLKTFEKDGIAELQLFDTDAVLTYLLPREDDKAINRLAGDLKQWNQRKKDQVEAMIAYVLNNKACRSNQILKYFGEQNDANCGICSVCKTGPAFDRSKTTDLADRVLELLNKPKSSKVLSEEVEADEGTLISTLRLLMESSRIGINEMNQYYKV